MGGYIPELKDPGVVLFSALRSDMTSSVPIEVAAGGLKFTCYIKRLEQTGGIGLVLVATGAPRKIRKPRKATA